MEVTDNDLSTSSTARSESFRYFSFKAHSSVLYKLVYSNLMCSSPVTLNSSPTPDAPMAQQALVGQGLLIIEASRSHTPHSVELVRTNDQLHTGTSTWQHTSLTRDRQPCFRRDSNPQSQ